MSSFSTIYDPDVSPPPVLSPGRLQGPPAPPRTSARPVTPFLATLGQPPVGPIVPPPGVAPKDSALPDPSITPPTLPTPANSGGMTGGQWGDLWAKSDSGRAALVSLQGRMGMATVLTATSLIMAMSMLIPVEVFAPSYAMNKRMPVVSLSAFVALLKSQMPDLHADIIAVTTKTGLEAREALRSVTARVFGTFGGQHVHSTFVYALMVFMWASPESAVADEMYMLLIHYLSTPPDQLAEFGAWCADPYKMPPGHANMATTYLLDDVTTLPGWQRLDYTTATTMFNDHWHFLWACCTSLLSREQRKGTVSDALAHIDPLTFAAQAPAETLPHFFARMASAYARTKADLTAMGRMELLPHPDVMVSLIYDKALRKYTDRVLVLLRAPGSTVVEADLTLHAVEHIYLQAAQELSRNFPGLTAAAKAARPPKDATPSQPPTGKGGKGKGAAARPAASQTPSTTTPTGSTLDVDSAGKPLEPLGKYAKHPTPQADKAQQRLWAEAGSCTNCGNVGPYPPHKPSKCPYEMLHGARWWAPHKCVDPIAQPNLQLPAGRQHKPLAAPVVAPSSSRGLAPAMEPDADLDDGDLPAPITAPVLVMPSPIGVANPLSAPVITGDSNDANIGQCCRDGCPCESYNGHPNEYCCRTCRDGQACKRAYHRMSPPPHYESAARVDAQVEAVPVALCCRPNCPCDSYNGVAGQYCCRTCRDEPIPCKKRYHRAGPPGASPPPLRESHMPRRSDPTTTPRRSVVAALLLYAIVVASAPTCAPPTGNASGVPAMRSFQPLDHQTSEWHVGSSLALMVAMTTAAPVMFAAHRTTVPRNMKTCIAMLALLCCIVYPTMPHASFPPHLAQTTTFIVAQAAAHHKASANRVGVFNAFCGVDLHSATRLTVGPDSFADVSLISPDKVSPEWKTTQMAPMSVTGIGGKADLVTSVEIPMRLQWGAPLILIHAYVAATPPDVDLLMGVDVLDFLHAKIDRGAPRVTFPPLGISMQLSSVGANLRRVATRPLTVLATCSGCNFVYCTMRNLGFTIDKWVSVDNDAMCRRVTAKLVPPSQLEEPCHDMASIPRALRKRHVDLHINTSPCQSFSRLQHKPLGFADKARAMPMVAAADLHRSLKRVNPHISKLVENVQFHPSLQVDNHKFQNMWADSSVVLNASDFGSPSSRPRQYMTDIVDLATLRAVPKLSPNDVLPLGRHCSSATMPCIVASPKTHTIPSVFDADTSTHCRLTAQESERMQGYHDDISAVPGVAATYEQRLRMIGNALNAHQTFHILQHYQPRTPQPSVCAAQIDMHGLTAAQLEVQLGAMSSAQLHTWVRSRMAGWTPEPLHLQFKPGQQPFAKPRRGFSTPAGLAESMQYMLHEQIRKGYMEEVTDYTHDMFVSQGFVQAKPGRYFPGTDIPMCRLLVDCRALNRACVDSPVHHYDCTPSQQDMCSRVPLGSKFFKFYDLSDAFHTCLIHPQCANLVIVQFNGKLYRYLGGAQGIANMAVHWNIHLMDSFDRVLGLHWREWYTVYVDDLGVHGLTREQATTRGRILEAVLTVLEKPFSDKTKDGVQTSLDIAGLHFTEHGVRLSDEAFDALEQCLREYPVKTARDVQHVVGTIQYSNTAFEWPGLAASAEYSSLLSQLTRIASMHPKAIPQAWTNTYPPIRDKLLGMMRKRAWAYLDPNSIIDDESCLVMVTDASDTAVAVTLFRVKRADAAQVTKTDLQDPTVTQIVGVAYKKLTHNQLAWHTFESELYAIVVGVKKFGKFITTATVTYPLNGVKKLAVWSDSTTALSQWTGVTLPSSVTEHLSAKARRFFGWADKLAYTRYWPMVTRHLPGADNDISHMLSHLGEQTRQRHDYLTAIAANAIACPATLHTFHAPVQGAPELLEQYQQVHLQLNAEDYVELERAYLTDDTLVNEVPIRDIFAVVTNHPSQAEVPRMHRDKIRAWANRRFFSVPARTGTTNLLMTAASAVVHKYPDNGDPADLTRHLVTVLPRGAAVQLTTTTPVSAVVGDGHHYADHDLRRDVLIHCHDNANHTSHATTSQHVRALVWFPGMRQYVKYHVDSCAYCVAARTSATPVGVAVRAARRLKLVEFDHKKLTAAAAAATGHAAVLTVVDVVSRVTMFIPVVSLTAEDTARALFIRWYAMFGVPAIFRCDGDPGYTSSVMKAFAALLGVKAFDFSAPDNPTHHGTVERRNRVMEKLLDVAISKGDLNSSADLHMYCAMATATCNLEHVFNGHTVLEYLTGEVPRTHNDVVALDQLVALGPEMNSVFLRQLRTLLTENNDLVRLVRDDNARYNALVRDAAQHRRQATQFTLLPGDHVSYDGKLHTLIDLVESTPHEPTKAVIRSVDHQGVDTITVRYAALRPLADPRPVHMHTSPAARVQSVSPGDFVFFSQPNVPHVMSGVVTFTDGNAISVHEYRQAPIQRTRQTPLYINTQTGQLEAKTQPRAHHTPVMHDITITDIHVLGSISLTLHIDDVMFDTLRAIGVVDQ